jgi:tRNA1Val (adenine37-N6)-methyltransferase
VRTCSADEIAASHRGCADIVLCNPPYFEAGTGRPAKDPQKARARSGHLAEFVRATRALLGRRGKGCFVYPARDLLRLMAELRTVGLEPKRLRFVHPTAEDGARVALVEARAAKPGGLDVEKPLVERTQGIYTEEMQRILSGSP